MDAKTFVEISAGLTGLLYMVKIVTMSPVITVSKLSKKYGALSAVNEISFSVNKGEIFGLLGENGAGKTTTLEIIEGLRRPTKGSVTVLGHDVTKDLRDIKSKIGVQLQSSAYYSFLTLTEILELFGSFYRKQLDAKELLSMVHLDEKAKSYVSQLSGGQKQRFSIVASLVNDPEIVFLDEPTTGLDPLARRHLWDLIASIRDKGKTIVLTTHYMEEAELLCNRIAIMEKGKIVAQDETHQLLHRAEFPYKISFVTTKGDGKIPILKKLGHLTELAGKTGHYEIALKNREAMNKSLDLIRQLNPENLSVEKASLEDVFIELTGKHIAQDEGEDD